MRRSQNFFGIWAAVALFVVTLRAFIPDGLMLDQAGPDGQLSIVICTSQGVQSVQPDGDTGSQHPDGDHGCAFAVAAHGVFAALPLLAPAPAVAGPGRYWLPTQQARATLAAPPLPARGPPPSA